MFLSLQSFKDKRVRGAVLGQMDQPSNLTFGWIEPADGTIADGDLEAPAANAGAETASNLFVSAPTIATVTTHPAIIKAFNIFHVKTAARACIKLGGQANVAMSNIDCVKTMSVEQRLLVARGVLDDLIAEDDDSFPDMTTCHGDYVYIVIGLWTSASDDDTETQPDRKSRVARKLEELTEENLARVRVSVQHHRQERPPRNDNTAQRAAGAECERTQAAEERYNQRVAALEARVRDAELIDMQTLDVMKDHIRGITYDMQSLIAAISDMQTAIVRMSVEQADMKASILLLESAATAPSAFWAQLLVASSADPAVQSTTVAFKVVPLAADVDDLKDAVAVKMRLSVAVPFLKVWVYDAASNRWVPVDEDSALVANGKATAYHVVVP